MAPDGSELAPISKPQPDATLVKALARAWRWQRMLDDGVYASVSDIGDAENISKSYVSRILRLALLAPDINEAILERRTDQSLMLRGLSGRCRRVGTSRMPAQRTHVLRTTSAFVCEMPNMHVSGQTPSSMAFGGPGPPNPSSISWSPLSWHRASVLRVRSAQR